MSTGHKWPSDDPRIGHLVTQMDIATLEPFPLSTPTVAIIGFPYDEGTLRNGGRGGATEGPRVFRNSMKYRGTVVNPATGADLNNIKIVDLGNVEGDMKLEEAHLALTDRVAKALRAGCIPFVVGGSNDQSYPNASALLDACKGDIGVVNIDAHLDVRPLINGMAHSGSPFRQLLEDERFQQGGGRFAEFATQGMQCATSHAEYVESKKHTIVWLDHMRSSAKTPQAEFQRVMSDLKQNVFVSFDVDSIRASDCPGVSCPGTVGLSAQEALDMCVLAGQNANVRLVDCSEFNPKVEDYLTGRLLAYMFYHFCMGVALRAAKE